MIDRYLESLRKRLIRRLPGATVEDHLKEISAHLRADAEGRARLGEEDTEVAAVRAFGSDYLVADSLIRTHEKIDARSIWRHARLPAAILVVAGIESVVTYNWRLPLDVQRWMALTLPFVFCIAFCLASWRSRRIVIGPVLAAMAFAMGAPFLTSFVKAQLPGTPESWQKGMLPRARHDVTYADAAASMITSESARIPYPAILRHGAGFTAPVAIDPRKVSSWDLQFGFVTGPEASEAKARSAWLSLSQPERQSLALRVDRAHRSLAIEERSISRYWGVFTVAAWWAAVLFGLNLTVMALEAGRRRAIGLMWQWRRS